jgi:succinate dehydrogenase / fumarate reductase, membrane anchor subunit
MTGSVNFNDMRNPLARAKNSGSAKTGSHHWLAEQTTSLALLPLTLWFAYAAFGWLSFSENIDLLAWLQNPIHALLLSLFVGIGAYHAKLRGPEMLLDYVHHKPTLIASLLLYKFLCWALGILGVGAVIILFFLPMSVI